MKFVSDILAKAGLVVDGVVTLNNTATGQTPAADDNSTKLATTAWVQNYVVPYSLPIASDSILGGIKVGTGLTIDASGILSIASGGGSSAAFRSDQTFVATAGQTTFTVTNGYTPDFVDVFLNGVYLNKTEYTATNGTTIILDDASVHNDIVTVFSYSPYVIGELPSARDICRITATAGQTTFLCTYAVGQIDVYYNGSKLDTSEYTATNGTSVVLGTAAVAGDKIEIITWLVGGGISANRTITINGVTYDLSANRTWSTLPTGGNAGQLLSKVDGSDYNVQWIDEAPAASYTSQVKHRVKSSQAITKGQAVYVSSADGTNMIVSKASNASEGTSSKTMGLLESTVAINGTANVVTEGLIAGLDTTGANAAGDAVWLGTNGDLIYGLVNKPVAPAHLVFIGVVTRRNANNGEIFVKVQNGFEMDELHDYVQTGVQNNDVISYESSTSLYKPKSIATLLGYTPQAALSGTGFVKISGTTITYDNSTYLTTSSAASTYLPLAGGTLTGSLGGTSASFSGIITANSQTTAANGSINIESLDPAIRFRVTSGTANNRIYEWRAAGAGGVNNFMELRLWNDAQSSATTLFRVQSTGESTFLSHINSGGWIAAPNNFGITARNAANTAGRILIKLNTSNQIEIGRDSDISGIILGTASQLNALSIASDGAATFSSTITATRLTVNADNSGVIVDVGGRHGFMKYFNYGTGLVGRTTDTDGGISTWLGRFSGSITSPTTVFQDLIITNAGHIGVRVIPTSGWGSAMSALQIGTGGVLSNWTGANNNFQVGVNYYDNGAGSQLRLYTGATSKIDFSSDNISFSNAASGSAGAAIAFTERLQITSSGTIIARNGGQFRIERGGNYRVNSNTDGLIGYLIRSGSWKGNSEDNLALATDGPYGISFFTNGSGSERLHITSAGRVGIGMTGPEAALQVAQPGQDDQLILGSAANNRDHAMFIYSGPNKAEVFRYQSGVRLIIGSGPNISNVDVVPGGNGVRLASGNTSWSAFTSDARRKKNFETVPGLEAVLQINPVKYHFNTQDDSEVKKLGFTAQNLLPLIPEMVHPNGEKETDGSDTLTIIPDYILPVLVKALQEQQSQIEELKEIIKRNNII
jgi:hypothetical protein